MKHPPYHFFVLTAVGQSRSFSSSTASRRLLCLVSCNHIRNLYTTLRIAAAATDRKFNLTLYVSSFLGTSRMKNDASRASDLDEHYIKKRDQFPREGGYRKLFPIKSAVRERERATALGNDFSAEQPATQAVYKQRMHITICRC